MEKLRSEEEIIEDDLQFRIDYYKHVLESVYLSPEWREAYEGMLNELILTRDGPGSSNTEDSGDSR